jgi:hypothetical protein
MAGRVEGRIADERVHVNHGQPGVQVHVRVRLGLPHRDDGGGLGLGAAEQFAGQDLRPHPGGPLPHPDQHDTTAKDVDVASQLGQHRGIVSIHGVTGLR